MDHSDKRVHPRMQFFLLQMNDEHGRKLVPVYSFRSGEDASAIAALVVDLSEGGLQILTNSDVEMPGDDYELQIQGHEESSLGRQMIHRVWQKSDGMHIRCGFSFTDKTVSVQEIGNFLKNEELHLLRCALYPC